MRVNIGIVILTISSVRGADPTCSRGIKDYGSLACCPSYCGTCGGGDCANRNGGPYNCCSSKVLGQNRSCSAHEAPCTRAASGDSTCSNGIKSSDGVCCPWKCGRCGGDGCQYRSGGSYSCCSGSIKSTNNYCDTHSAPCIMKTTTSTGGSSDSSCSNGIKDSSGKQCCPKTCGACGGPGCENRYGGYGKCCANGVDALNKSCSSNVAPCTLSSTSSGGGGVTGSVHRTTHVGVLVKEDDWLAAEREFGVQLDTGLIYQEIGSLSFWNVQKRLEQGFNPTVVIEVIDSYPNESSIIGGKYDYKLKAFGYAAAKFGKKFSIRTMHEGNGDWYSWGIFRGGSNSESNFKSAFRHIVSTLRSTGAQLEFELSLNNQNPRDNPRPFVNFNPGEEYYDRICISAYNRCGVDRWHHTQESFHTVFSSAYNQIKSFTNKPICVGEVSTTGNCGSKVSWIQAAWNSMAFEFPRVTHVYWFLENKSPYYWDLNSSGEVWAWSEGFKSFKSATS